MFHTTISKCKARVSKFLLFEKRFRKAPFSWRVSVDGRPTGGNKAAFSGKFLWRRENAPTGKSSKKHFITALEAKESDPRVKRKGNLDQSLNIFVTVWKTIFKAFPCSGILTGPTIINALNLKQENNTSSIRPITMYIESLSISNLTDSFWCKMKAITVVSSQSHQHPTMAFRCGQK